MPPKPHLRKSGYHTLNLYENTVEKIKQDFKDFQAEIGEVYANPDKSQFLDLLLRLWERRGEPNLERLMLVSKGPSRIVMYDTQIKEPVAVSVDKKGGVNCSRVAALDQYMGFARRQAPELFKKWEAIKERKDRGPGRPKGFSPKKK